MTTEEEQEQEPSLFATILEDVRILQKRAKKATALETKHEMAVNIYPLLEKIVQACMENEQEVADIGGALDEFIEGQSSVIQPPLAAGILALCGLGKEITAAVRELELDDVTRAKLTALCDRFDEGVDQVAPEVQAAAVPIDGPDDEDEEDGAEDDADDDDEAAAAKATKVEE